MNYPIQLLSTQCTLNLINIIIGALFGNVNVQTSKDAIKLFYRFIIIIALPPSSIDDWGCDGRVEIHRHYINQISHENSCV